MTRAGGTMSSLPPAVLDVHRLREQFPILSEKVHGKPLVYLDNAATSQKPQAVIDALSRYYTEYNANVHRGLHRLSELATNAYEQARGKVQRFLGASDAREIVFTRGTTEAINLVAQAWGRANLKAGDEVLISHMEHHSNILPWQMVCEQIGAKLRVIPINDRGELLMDEFTRLLTDRTRIVSVVHVSNALGTINPVNDIVSMAHERGALAMIDGAQAAAHMQISVRDLDCDFYAVSGHKMFGPTGIGALYGKSALLQAMPPYQGGGEMIKNVTFEKTLFADPPTRFEAGTPHIAGAIGMGAAIDWIKSLDWRAVGAHEHELLKYGTERLLEIPGLRLIGTAVHKAAVLSFVIESQHPYELGQILDHDGVAIRTGHHCTQPLMERFGVPATCRASLAMYNTREEIDALIDALRKAARMLA